MKKIADIVISGNRYQEQEKLDMMSRKAMSIYTRARDRLNTDATDAIKSLRDALLLHLRVFKVQCVTGNARADITEKYARNTTYTLFNVLGKEAPWDAFDAIRGMMECKDVYLDPVEEPVRQLLLEVSVHLKGPDLIGRMRQKLKAFNEGLARKDLWLVTGTRQAVIDATRSCDVALAEGQRR